MLISVTRCDKVKGQLLTDLLVFCYLIEFSKRFASFKEDIPKCCLKDFLMILDLLKRKEEQAMAEQGHTRSLSFNLNFIRGAIRFKLGQCPHDYEFENS